MLVKLLTLTFAGVFIGAALLEVRSGKRRKHKGDSDHDDSASGAADTDSSHAAGDAHVDSPA